MQAVSRPRRATGYKGSPGERDPSPLQKFPKPLLLSLLLLEARRY